MHGSGSRVDRPSPAFYFVIDASSSALYSVEVIQNQSVGWGDVYGFDSCGAPYHACTGGGELSGSYALYAVVRDDIPCGEVTVSILAN